MANKIRHLLHRRSLKANPFIVNIERDTLEVQNPKAPFAENIEYGELAVNYGKGHEGLFLRNSENEVIQLNTMKHIRYDGAVDKSFEKYLDDRYVNRSGDTMYGDFTITKDWDTDDPKFRYIGSYFLIDSEDTDISGNTLDMIENTTTIDIETGFTNIKEHKYEGIKLDADITEADYSGNTFNGHIVHSTFSGQTARVDIKGEGDNVCDANLNLNADNITTTVSCTSSLTFDGQSISSNITADSIENETTANTITNVTSANTMSSNLTANTVNTLNDINKASTISTIDTAVTTTTIVSADTEVKVNTATTDVTITSADTNVTVTNATTDLTVSTAITNFVTTSVTTNVTATTTNTNLEGTTVNTNIDTNNINTTIDSNITTKINGTVLTDLVGDYTLRIDNGEGCDSTLTIDVPNIDIDASCNFSLTVEGVTTYDYNDNVTTTIDGEVKTTIVGNVTKTTTGNVIETLNGSSSSTTTGNVTEIVNGTESTTISGTSHTTIGTHDYNVTTLDADVKDANWSGDTLVVEESVSISAKTPTFTLSSTTANIIGLDNLNLSGKTTYMSGVTLDVNYQNVDLSGSTDIDIVSPIVNIDASNYVDISGLTEVHIDSLNGTVDIDGKTTTMDGDLLYVTYNNIDIKGNKDIDIVSPDIDIDTDSYTLSGATTVFKGSSSLTVNYPNIDIDASEHITIDATSSITLNSKEINISGDTNIYGDLIISSGNTFNGQLEYDLVFETGDGDSNRKIIYNNTTTKTISYVHHDGDTMNGKLTINVGNNNTALSTVGKIEVDGTINCTSAIYSSDKDLKENIKKINKYDIATVADVELKSYKFIDDETHRERYGVIAQDLESVGLEHLVVKKENGKKGVDYISFLILKIAQLEKEIEELKNKK